MNRPLQMVAAALCFQPVAARANIVWPALYLAIRLLSWQAISTGLLVELFVVRRMFNLPVKRAASATLVANLVSSLVGLLLIPLVGFGWEIGPASVLNDRFNFGTFNPLTWVAMFLLACFLNTAIEWAVYKNKFKLHFEFSHFAGLLAANALSVGVACASLYVYPFEN